VDNAAPGGHGPAPVRPARSHAAHAPHPQSAHPQSAHPQSAHPQSAHPQSAHPQSARESDTGHGGVVTLFRVLLLNASHEPLAVSTGRRALILVVAGKAECVAERSSAVRSPSLVVAVPRWSGCDDMYGCRTRHRPRSPVPGSCGATSVGAPIARTSDTVDHVVPKSRGGAHSWENCVACCVRCNTRKADRLLPELGWSLPFVPAAPRRGVFGGLWSEDADPAWKPWLLGAA